MAISSTSTRTNVERKRSCNSQYFKDEDGRILGDIELIARWIRWFRDLLNTKSSTTLNPNNAGDLKAWPTCRPHDDVPSIFEVRLFLVLVEHILWRGVLSSYVS